MKHFFTFSLLIVTISVIAQTGPGGIGSSTSNGFWLKADDITLPNGSAVSSWLDASGNGNHAAQSCSYRRPTFYSSSNLNGMPVIRFDGTNDKMKILDDSMLDGSSGITFYAVIRPTNLNGNPKSILSKKSSYYSSYYYSYSNYTYKWFFSSSGYLNADINTSNNRFNTSPFSFTNNNNYIVNLSFDGSLPYSSRSSITGNGSNIATASESSTSVVNSCSSIYLGTSNSSCTPYLGADYAEIIHFNYALNSAQHIIIQNYLSAKYAINLTSNDIYTQSSPANGNYDFDVAGIGRVDSNNLHDDSKGSGMIRVKNPSNLNDNEFLIWGRDNGSLSLIEGLDNPSGISSRLERTWRVSESDSSGVSVDVGSIKMIWDLTDLSQYNATDLRLLVDTDNDGSFADETPITGSLVNNKLKFINLTNLSDNSRFTLGSISEGEIIWDGTAYQGGSGILGAPSIQDFNKTLHIMGSNAWISENAAVKQLMVDSTTDITVDSTFYLKVRTDIINNGTVTVLSDASLIQSGTGTNNNSGDGNYVIERRGNSLVMDFNIWSSPIQAASIPVIFPNDDPCNIMIFERQSLSFTLDYLVGSTITCGGNNITLTANDVISGGDGIMNPGIGYYIPGTSPSTRIYNGSINNGDITIPGSSTSTAGTDFNLLGNPYPSSISGFIFWYENYSSISDALYFWEEIDTTGGFHQYTDYASWNLLGGVNAGNIANIPNGYIGAGQGFWYNSSATTDVFFKNNMRTDTAGTYLKTGNTQENHLAWINFTAPSTLQNNILIGYNTQTTDGIDSDYDAHKLGGNPHIRLASMIKNEEFVIQAISSLNVNDSKTIPLTVFTDESGTHTFEEYKRENLGDYITVYLYDKTLNITTNLRTEKYVVSLVANADYSNRFELILKYELSQNNENTNQDDLNVVASVNDINNKSSFHLIQNEQGITLNNKNGIKGLVQVTDVTGKILWSQNISHPQNKIDISLNNLAFGIYFIQVSDNQNQIFHHKFVR